jgi:hypothetical protein
VRSAVETVLLLLLLQDVALVDLLLQLLLLKLLLMCQILLELKLFHLLLLLLLLKSLLFQSLLLLPDLYALLTEKLGLLWALLRIVALVGARILLLYRLKWEFNSKASLFGFHHG